MAEATGISRIGAAVQDKNKVLGLAVVGVGSFIAYKQIKKAIDKKRANELAAQAGNSPLVAQAAAFYSAMHESGFMNTGWGTDETRIFETAKQVKDLPGVQQMYRQLYPGRDLMVDLRNELSGADYTRFVNIVSSVTAITPAGQTNAGVRSLPEKDRENPKAAKPTVNNIVISKKEVRIRFGTANKTAFDWLRTETFAARAFLGFTTGKTVYNSKDNIYYMEIWWYDGKSRAKKTAWVTTSKDFVSVYAWWKDAMGANGGSIRLYGERALDKNGKAPATHVPLNGLGNAAFQVKVGKMLKKVKFPQIFSKVPATIYTSDLRWRVGVVAEDRKLGRKIDEIISDRGMRYTRFKDLGGRIRMVQSRQIQVS